MVRRQKPTGDVTFFYADDMNDPTTEATVRYVFMSLETEPLFRPARTTWVKCHNTTFLLHTGKCGPRMLTHSSIMSYHPSPSEHMLSSLMYPNLAYACRVWTAITILTQHFNLHDLQQYLNEPSTTIQEITPQSATGVTHNFLHDTYKTTTKNRNRNSEKHAAQNTKRHA